MTTAALLLMAVGFAVCAWGIRREAAGLRRPVTEAAKGFAMVRAFRTVVLGLALVGVGAAWLWHVPPLLGLSLVIAGEELLETSVVIAACRSAVVR